MEEETQFISLYEQYLKNNESITDQAKVILSSIEQTLKQQTNHQNSLQSNQQNYTSIYCSLLSLLQTNISTQSHNTTISLLFLLNFTIPQLSLGVIQRTEQQLHPLLHQVFKAELPAENKQNIQKYTLHVISKLLTGLTLSQYSQQNSKQSFELIMECMIKESLTLRTLACHIFTKLFAIINPVLKETLFEFQKFIISQLQLPDSNALTMCKSMQLIILTFPMNQIYDLIYQLMRLFQLSQDYTLNTHILLIIERVMANKQIESDISENVLKQCLENGMMMIEEDEKFVFAFAQTVVQTLLQLHTFNQKKAEKYIAACLSICSEIFFLGDHKFQSFAEKSMQMILSYTIRPNLWTTRQQQPSEENDQIFNQFFSRIEKLELDEQQLLTPYQQKIAKQSKQFTQFYKIVYIVKYLLSQRFETVQEFTLNVVAVFFEQLDESAVEFVEEIITTLVETRNKRPQIPFKKCFGTIIQRMHVPTINRLFPLTFSIPDFLTMNTENYEQSSNLWLLPVYSKSIKNESIITFIEIFYELIKELEVKLEQYKQDSVKQKFLEFLIGQLWAIFPKCTEMPQKALINNQLYQEQLSKVSEFLPILTNLILSDLPGYNQRSIYQGTGQVFINISELTMQFSLQAEQMFPKLVQKLRINNPNGRVILGALNSLAKTCGKEYLNRVFGNNLKKIVVDVNNNNGKFNLKNFDILVQIADAMNNMDEFFEQIMMLFKKASQLENNQESQKLNKRIYKLMGITIKKMHFTYLHQIQTALQESINNVDSSYRHQRLVCVKLLWEYLVEQRSQQKSLEEIQQSGVLTDMTNFIQQFLPEIIVTFNDKNHRIRKLGHSLFDIICNQMKQFNLLTQFTELLTGGLAGSKSIVRSCTIQALRLMVAKFKSDIEESMKKIEDVILILVEEGNSEVYLSIVKFITKMIQIYPHNDSQIKNLLQILLINDQRNRELYRSQIQHLIEKLLRKLGAERLMGLVPKEQCQLVRYVEKERRKLKKKKMEGGDRKDKVDQFLQGVFKADREFQEDDDEDQQEFQRKNKQQQGKGMEMESQYSQQQQGLIEDKNLLLKYDLLKDRFHFTEHSGVKKLEEMKKKNEQNSKKKEEKDVEFVNGKLIVRGEKVEEFGKKRKREGLDMEEKMKDMAKDETKHTKLVQSGSQANVNAIVNKKSRKTNKLEEKQQSGIHIMKESGSRFKLKGALPGDVQKQNQPSPYAFIQLNPKVLNKRYKAQGVKSFEVLMKQSGSFKGIKEKKVKKN